MLPPRLYNDNIRCLRRFHLLHLWTYLKARIAANALTVIASMAVIAAMLFIPYRNYRWVGHGIIGLLTFAFVAVTMTYGATLAGRIRRPPNRNRFRLHRRYGITAGILLIATLSYGLWLGRNWHFR